MTTNNDKTYQQMLIDKLSSKPGLKGKIDAKCVECIYDPYQNGTWRQQVTKCTSTTCPLYSARPKSNTNQQ